MSKKSKAVKCWHEKERSTGLVLAIAPQNRYELQERDIHVAMQAVQRYVEAQGLGDVVTCGVFSPEEFSIIDAAIEVAERRRSEVLRG